MDDLFKNARTYWVRYSAYEIKEDKNGIRFVIPAKDSMPKIYNPLDDAAQLVLDAVNVGLASMNGGSDEEAEHAVMGFVAKYGLLGFIAALPTTPKFLDYQAVYLPKNPFIKEETMGTLDFLKLFFPFRQAAVTKNGFGYRWDIRNDRTMMALALAFEDDPAALNICYQRDYGERYDWLLDEFRSLAYNVCLSFFYYLDYDNMDDLTREIHRKGMAAFGGNVPTYHIELRDCPTLVWDFHSLILCIQMMLSLMLTDSKTGIKLCKHCQKAFVAERPNAVFCSQRCKNQYNVYKSRAKNGKNKD